MESKTSKDTKPKESPFTLVILADTILIEFPLYCTLSNNLSSLNWDNLDLDPIKIPYNKSIITALDIDNIILLRQKYTNLYRFVYRSMINLEDNDCENSPDYVSIIACPGTKDRIMDLKMQYYDNIKEEYWFKFSEDEVKDIVKEFLLIRFKYGAKEQNKTVNIKVNSSLSEDKFEKNIKEQENGNPTERSIEINNKEKGESYNINNSSGKEDIQTVSKEDIQTDNKEKANKEEKSSDFNNRLILNEGYKEDIVLELYTIYILEYLELDIPSLLPELHKMESIIHPLCNNTTSEGKICARVAVNMFSEPLPDNWRCIQEECQNFCKTINRENVDSLYKYLLIISEIVESKYKYIVTDRRIWELSSGKYLGVSSEIKIDNKDYGVLFEDISSILTHRVWNRKEFQFKEYDKEIDVVIRNEGDYDPDATQEYLGIIKPKPSPKAKYYEFDNFPLDEEVCKDRNTLLIEDEEDISVWKLFRDVKCLFRIPKKGINCKKFEKFEINASEFLVCHYDKMTEIWDLEFKCCIVRFIGRLA